MAAGSSEIPLSFLVLDGPIAVILRGPGPRCDAFVFASSFR